MSYFWNAIMKEELLSYYKEHWELDKSKRIVQHASSFYNAKEELCRDERKHIEDRENENKPTKTFETVNEGFYHDRYIRVRRKKNALNKKTNQYAVVRTL